jgi:hypothetical protein
MSTSKAVSVVGLYKRLHRTSQKVFKGDDRAIQMARSKIRSEFLKNQAVNGASVTELIQIGTLNLKILFVVRVPFILS